VRRLEEALESHGVDVSTFSSSRGGEYAAIDLVV
jgi:hypothetical protein